MLQIPNLLFQLTPTPNPVLIYVNIHVLLTGRACQLLFSISPNIIQNTYSCLIVKLEHQVFAFFCSSNHLHLVYKGISAS